MQPGQTIQLESRRGRITAMAQVTDRVAEGVVFANFHFAVPHNANELTHLTLDPLAKIPEYKVTAVRVICPPSSASASEPRPRTH